MTQSTETLFDETTLKNINQWLTGDYDLESELEIQSKLIENPASLIDPFFKSLSFGTGGLRGIVGIGTNRINQYTIRKATQGLANVIQKLHPQAISSVIIAYDSRHSSRFLAEEAAKVLAGNGINVFLFNNLRPTPLLSFGCRALNCTAGIMITASHNPPEYNGYKVYWSDGAQITNPYDQHIMHEMQAIDSIQAIHTLSHLNSPFIHHIGNSVDQEYLSKMKPLQFYPDQNQTHGKDLHVIYSSLHGTGITLIPQLLPASC